MPQTINSTRSITVVPSLQDTSPSTLPNAVVGQAYSFQLTASGGTTPYVWSGATNMPPGLTISASGLVAGTPTTNGFSSFSYTLKDSSP